MCWSFEVSLGTLAFVAAGSVYLYLRNHHNDRFYAVYIFIISLMQGTDAMAWYSIDRSMPELNHLSAVLSSILINAQIPLIYGYLSATTKNSRYYPIFVVSTMYLLYSIYYVFHDNEAKGYKVTVNENCKECHLSWSWLRPFTTNSQWLLAAMFVLYSLGVLYPLFTTRDKRNVWMIFIWFMTLFYAVLKYANTREWGSYWCSIVNIWVLVAIFYKQ